jgi:hypothetical protein
MPDKTNENGTSACPGGARYRYIRDVGYTGWKIESQAAMSSG